MRRAQETEAGGGLLPVFKGSMEKESPPSVTALEVILRRAAFVMAVAVDCHASAAPPTLSTAADATREQAAPEVRGLVETVRRDF